jgi:hypothetical protein
LKGISDQFGRQPLNIRAFPANIRTVLLEFTGNVLNIPVISLVVRYRQALQAVSDAIKWCAREEDRKIDRLKVACIITGRETSAISSA